MIEANPLCLCVTVRSRSLLFYNDGAPLEESLVTSEGERLQSEPHSHIQISRYTADAHSNQTNGPSVDQRWEPHSATLSSSYATSQTTLINFFSSVLREKKPDGVSEFFWQTAGPPPPMTSHLWPLQIPELSWTSYPTGPKPACFYITLSTSPSSLSLLVSDFLCFKTSSQSCHPPVRSASLLCFNRLCYTWIYLILKGLYY